MLGLDTEKEPPPWINVLFTHFTGAVAEWWLEYVSSQPYKIVYRTTTKNIQNVQTFTEAEKFCYPKKIFDFTKKL